MRKLAYQEMFENELNHAWYLGTRKLMVRTLRNYLKKNAKTLDAGCGTGGTIVYLKKNGFKNITGIDTSSYALKLARKRNLNNVKIGSVNKIPFADKTFDAVICLDVLYHRGVSRKIALKEFFRVLKNDGILYLQEPSYNWLKSTHDQMIETKHRFDKNEIENLLKSAEFEIVKISHFNIIFFLPILAKRILNNTFLSNPKTSDVSRLPTFLNYLLLMSLSLESRALKLINFPFGLSVISLARKTV